MRISNLKKTIESFQLQIDDLYIEEKKIHGIIGGNGCGKSTLAKLIMGIEDPDGGTIDYGSLNQSDITMMFQRPYLLHESVYDNIVFPLKIRKIEPNQEEIDQWLKRYGLYDKKKRYARSLSSGERQKLSFVRAMIFEPELVIIDETFSNLDPDTVTVMEDWILQKQKESPITYIVISHQIGNIFRLCDQVHVLDKGHVVESGPTEQVLLYSENPAIRNYMKSHILPDVINEASESAQH